MVATSWKQRAAFSVQSPNHMFKLLGILCLFVFGAFIFREHQCECRYQKERIICIEDYESDKVTGLESVQFLPFGGAVSQDCLSKVSLRGTPLNDEEQERAKVCVTNYESDYLSAHTLFWSDDNQYIRHTHHKYLTNESLVIDVGGNVGEDAEYFLRNYRPKSYVILEPLKLLYRGLVSRFKNRPHVVMYNIGLSKKNEKFMLSIEGNAGDATSPFRAKASEGTCSLKVVNTTAFIGKLGVGCYDVDLVTINCEGCEYAVLESILGTSLVNNFKHIQFATHTKLANLVDPVTRYCEIQELLLRTHRLSYSYKFNWETWTRRDVTH